MDLSPEQEARRIAAVRRYDILDTPPDGAFDRIAALAARLFDAPAATVTIVDTDRVWFKAAYGLAGVTQIGREPGLCTSAILTGSPLVIPDTLHDPLARTHELVTGPARVRFYAAAPINTLRSTALLERDPCAVLRAPNSALLSASSDGSRFCT